MGERFMKIGQHLAM